MPKKCISRGGHQTQGVGIALRVRNLKYLEENVMVFSENPDICKMKPKPTVQY